MVPVPACNPMMPPTDTDTVVVNIGSSQTRRVEELTTRMEEYKETIKKAWFWKLNTYEDQAIRKLGDSIQAIFELAMRNQTIEREYLFVYLESMISLKLTFDEKQSRTGNCLTRRFRAVFGNRVVSSIAYVTGGVGLTVSGIAFGLSQFYGKGSALIVCTALGIITAAVGGSCALSANALKRYSEAIKVTAQDKRIQECFKRFFEGYLTEEYQECKRAIKDLRVADKLRITNEIVLLYLVNHLESNRGKGESIQKHLTFGTLSASASKSLEDSGESSRRHASALPLEEEYVEEDSAKLENQDSDLTADDLITIMRQYLQEEGNDAEEIAEGNADATKSESGHPDEEKEA